MKNSLILLFLLQLSISLIDVRAFSFFGWTTPISSFFGRSNISPLSQSDTIGFNIPKLILPESKFESGFSDYNEFGGYGWLGHGGYGGYGTYDSYSGLSGNRGSDSSIYDERRRVSSSFSKTESKWKTLNNTQSHSIYWYIG